MIGVKKIAHATYETPDLDQQIEYYTDILGLNLIAKEKDAAYLASTIDHHSVVLRKGGTAEMRAARLPARARRRSRTRSRSRPRRTASRRRARRIPSLRSPTW